jgi:hypothetical protein
MSAIGPLQPALLASAYRSADDTVLVSMPLRDGADRNRLSRFGEDVWDMDPAIFHMTARNAFRAVDFGCIASPIERLTAKEYIFAWLNERLPDGAARLRPLSTRAALATLRRFMAFVRDQLGTFDAAAIDQDLLDAYLALQKDRMVLPSRVASCLKPAAELRRLAPFLTCGGLTFVPWNGRSIFSVAGCRGRTYENVTPRIPEPVIGALLHWSLKYIDVFSVDIFAARAELDALEQRYAIRPRHAVKGSVVTKMMAWIEQRRQAGRGVPVWNAPSSIGGLCDAIVRSGRLNGDVLNIRLIALQSGLHITNMTQNEEAYGSLLAAVETLGVEPGGMDTPISIDPDTGRPWRARFDGFSLVREERYLQTAAYVLCSYLTGMRDSEVQAMRPGCLTRARRPDEFVERLAIQSTVYKGRGTRGEMEEWITIAPVARAVEVAERLSARYRARRGEEGVWIMLDRGQALERGLPHVVRQINRFSTHLDERYGVAGAPAIPLNDGRSWVFNTRQLRRTVAWYIANRPFGVVAGKIQYKHASVAMFDGYAGSSASGFRQEVEQERALGQLDDIVEQYEAYRRGEKPAGPAAIRVAAEMDRVGQELAPLPGRIVDHGRIKAMLGHLARTLHVGHLNDCFFEPATALCLDRSAEMEHAAPILSNCAPDRCPNSLLTRRHLPPWKASIAEAEELLKNKRLPRFQREALRHDNDRKRKLIAPLRTGAEP